MSSPLFGATDARIDARGSVLLEALSFQVTGSRVGLIGGWEPLFRLWSGDATLLRGSVTVLGKPTEPAVRENRLGIARRDTELPTEGKVVDFFEASARLLGNGRRAARAMADETLRALGVSALAKRAFSSLHGTERRAVGIAHAALGAPEVVALEAPLSGLDDEAARSIATLVDRVAAGRALIVSAEAPALVGAEMDLLARMDRLVVLASGKVVLEGAPEEVLRPSPRYLLRTGRAREALARALEKQGISVQRLDDGAVDAGRLVLLLRDGSDTSPIVDAALAVDAPLLEMLPVGISLPAVATAARRPLTRPTAEPDGSGS